MAASAEAQVEEVWVDKEVQAGQTSQTMSIFLHFFLYYFIHTVLLIAPPPTLRRQQHRIQELRPDMNVSVTTFPPSLFSL